MILVGHHYDYSVENLAAAKRFEHLHLETSRMAHLDAVTVAVRELGAERVLYGTGAPIRAMQSALNAILQAQISDDEKRLVLGGNAQRLFGLPGRAGAPAAGRRCRRARSTSTPTSGRSRGTSPTGTIAN